MVTYVLQFASMISIIIFGQHLAIATNVILEPEFKKKHLSLCSELYEISNAFGIWRPIIAFEHLLSYEKTKFYGGDKVFSFWYIDLGKGGIVVYHEEVQLSFSCPFNFEDYPFDTNECTLEFRSQDWPAKTLRLNPSNLVYESVVPPIKHRLEDDPMILNDLPHPFEFKFNWKPGFEKTNIYNYNFSYAAMEIRMKRKPPNELMSGYYYPMAAFAFLSMISFLIKPDVVSN